MGKFWLSPEAAADLDELHARIATESPRAADRVLESACATIRRLADNPGLGHPRQFRPPRLAGLRAKQVDKFRDHLIFYRTAADGIEIVRVLHGSRNLEAIFSAEEGV